MCLEVWLIGIINDIVIILAVCHILPSQKLHSCFGQERVLRLRWSGGLRKNYLVMCLDVDYWEATNLALDIFGYLWVYGIRFKRIEIKTVQRERGPANSRRWPAATPRKSPDAAIKNKDIFEQHCFFKVSCLELCDLIGVGCMATALIWCKIESVLWTLIFSLSPLKKATLKQAVSLSLFQPWILLTLEFTASHWDRFGQLMNYDNIFKLTCIRTTSNNSPNIYLHKSKPIIYR